MTHSRGLSGALGRALTVLLFFCCAAAAYGDDSRKRIVVGAFDYYPAIFRQADGTIAGIYVDMLREIEKSERVVFEFRWGTWAEGLERARSGEVDLLTSVAWTEERAGYLDYCAVPALTVWGELYQDSGARRLGVNDLNGKVIGVMKNDYNGIQYKQKIEEFGIKCRYREYASFADVFSAIKAGEVDAGVVSVLFGESKHESFGLIATGFAFSPFDIFFASPKGRNADARQLIDRYLTKWKDNPSSVYYNARYKWSGRAVETRIPSWLNYLLVAIASCLVLSLAFALMLRLRVGIVTKSLRQSESALTEKNDFITLLLDSTVEGIVAVRADSRCVLCNASFAALLGYESGADIPGLYLADVVAFCDGEGSTAGVRQPPEWLGLQQGRHLDKVRILRRDGSVFFAEVWFWPIKDEKGSASGTVMTLIDITDRMEAEKNRADKEIAERANHAKSAFIAKMSHELRTPLNSVIVLTGILRRHLPGKIDETDYSYLEVIERNGNFLLQQINEILDISRIESGNDLPVFAPCDVRALTLECVRTVEPLAEQKKLTLNFNSNVPEARVMTDASKFRHIVQNILTNAIKYTQRGGICVTLTQSEAEVSVAIEDTGVGIERKDLPHIFEEFYQVSDMVEMRQGGVGLGLAIAKRYGDLIGGNISVESEKGKGSVFRLTVPVGDVPAAAPLPAEALADDTAPSPSGAARKAVKNDIPTVLVIDDNPDSRTAEIALLRDSCSILSAENGYEGIVLALKERPDFILLDISMPILSGYDTIRLIRSIPAIADVVVIAVTAGITKDDRDSVLRSGFDAFVPKPIEYESLRAALRRFMA